MIDAEIIAKYRKVREHVRRPDGDPSARRIAAMMEEKYPGIAAQADVIEAAEKTRRAGPDFAGWAKGAPGGSGWEDLFRELFSGFSSAAQSAAREKAEQFVHDAFADDPEAAVRNTPEDRKQAARKLADKVRVTTRLNRGGLQITGTIPTRMLNTMLGSLSDAEVVWWARYIGRDIANAILAEMETDE